MFTRVTLLLIVESAITGGGSGGGGDSGSFFLACEDFGRIFDHSFPDCAIFFFFEVEISSSTLIQLFMPGSVHSGSAS